MLTDLQINPYANGIRRQAWARAQRGIEFHARKICPPIMVATDHVGVTFQAASAVAGVAGVNDTVSFNGSRNVVRSNAYQSVNFMLTDRALHAEIDPDKAKRSEIDFRAQSLGQVAQQMLVNDEIFVATALSNGANWSSSIALAQADAWGTPAGAANIAAVPANVLNEAARRLRMRAIVPDTVVVGGDVASILEVHPSLLVGGSSNVDNNFYGPDRVKDLIAAIFKVDRDRIFLANSVRNAAAEGLPEDLQFLHSNYIWAGRQLTTPAESLTELDMLPMNDAIEIDGGHSMEVIGLGNFISQDYEFTPGVDFTGGKKSLELGIVSKTDAYQVCVPAAGIAITGVLQ